jgi:hypothetical protein
MTGRPIIAVILAVQFCGRQRIRQASFRLVR